MGNMEKVMQQGFLPFPESPKVAEPVVAEPLQQWALAVAASVWDVVMAGQGGFSSDLDSLIMGWSVHQDLGTDLTPESWGALCAHHLG